MIEVKMIELPPCSYQQLAPVEGGICNGIAIYDTPVKGGSWAHVCQAHYDMFALPGAESIASTLVKWDRPKPKSNIEICAWEPSLDDLEYWEKVLIDGVRELKCPECDDIKRVEPDADYSYHCDGCGMKLHCPDPII